EEVSDGVPIVELLAVYLCLLTLLESLPAEFFAIAPCTETVAVELKSTLVANPCPPGKAIEPENDRPPLLVGVDLAVVGICEPVGVNVHVPPPLLRQPVVAGACPVGSVLLSGLFST